MKHSLQRFTTRTLLIAVFSISYILAAFDRGSYLFGTATGVVYALVATLVTFLVVRATSQRPLPKRRVCFIAVFAIMLSLAFAFPMYLNPDLRHQIHEQAIDRNARHELTEQFASDPAFSALRISTTHTKVLNVEIYGGVASKADLDRLRKQVLTHCQFVDQCVIRWYIHVYEDARIYIGDNDDELDVTAG